MCEHRHVDQRNQRESSKMDLTDKDAQLTSGQNVKGIQLSKDSLFNKRC